MTLLDRTDHSRFAREHAARIADRYIPAHVPATDRDVTRNDNLPPERVDVPESLLINGVEIERPATRDPDKELNSAKEAMAELSVFLKDNPVILTQAEAKTATGWIERTRIALQEARLERDTKTAPFNTALRKIREFYEIVREKSGSNRGGSLQAAQDETKRRLLAFMDAEKKRREAEAEIARQAAAEAERIAREAEAKEQEALANAQEGECTDVGSAIEQADAAFAGFQKAARAATIAERDTKVRIASGMGGRATSVQERRVLVVANVTDAIKALIAMGLDDETALLLARRAKKFEDAFGELPPGVTATFKPVI